MYIYSNNKCMCVFLISPVPITKPLTSELIDTPVFYNLAPRPIKYRVSVPIPTYLWYHSAPILCHTHTKYRSKPVRPSYDRCLHGVELSWRRRFHCSALGSASYAPNSSKDFSPLGQNTCFKCTSEDFNMHHPGSNHRHFQEKLCHLCSTSAI